MFSEHVGKRGTIERTACVVYSANIIRGTEKTQALKSPHGLIRNMFFYTTVSKKKKIKTSLVDKATNWNVFRIEIEDQGETSVFLCY